MFWKQVFAFGLLTLAALVLAANWTLRSLDESDLRHRRDEFSARLDLANDRLSALIAHGANAAIAEPSAVQLLARQMGGRLTIIDAEGNVLFDSDGDPRRMDNHFHRPEIVMARQRGIGEAIRRSETMGSEFYYLARRLNEGASEYIVRVAAPWEVVMAARRQRRLLVGRAAALAGAIAIALVVFWSHRFSSRVHRLSQDADRVALGDYDRPIDVSLDDELGNLARSFNRMRQELRQRIAGLEQARTDLQTMLETIPEGVIAVDAQQRILFANPSSFRLFGVVSADRTGQRLWEVLRSAPLQEAVTAAFDSSEPYNTEFEILHPPRVLQFRARRLHIQAGRGIIVVLHDISELRRLERLRQDFFTNVSHELKTPLASIKAFTETLLDNEFEDRETGIRFLRRIEEQADRLHVLVIDMLMLARVESEDHGFDVQTVDLHRIVEDGIDSFLGEADAKGIEIVQRLGADARWLRADPEGLSTLLGNLIDNAIKYTPAGGTIIVETALHDATLSLSVSDTGVGIPAEDLNRVFERFYRVDKARSRALGGTGLGLSIVKHLAATFGGNVGVSSELGRGSTFTARFPATAPSISPAARA